MKRAAYAIALVLLTFATLFSARPTLVGTVATQTDQSALPTFVDLPQEAVETYPGSGLYKTPISQAMSAAIDQLTQENWDKYHIAKESNLGLPLGSVYVRAQNGQYVELALYERAAFTIFHGQPARQILSTIIFGGKIQISETESVQLPDNIRQSFSSLVIAGEPDQESPTIDSLAKHLSTDPTKAEDAAVTSANQLLSLDGTLRPLDPSDNVEPLTLGGADPITGHRTAGVVSDGLSKLFGNKVVENAGLPLSEALWVHARVGGQQKVVGVQAFERMMVTYNPDNDEANRVQVGLGGAIVYQGLTNATQLADTPTPQSTVAAPTVTPSPGPEVLPNDGYGTWYQVTIYPELVASGFPGIFIDAPLYNNLKAIASNSVPYNKQLWKTQDLMLSSRIEAISKQAPTQPDGTVLDTEAKAIDYLVKHGELTYGIPAWNGSMNELGWKDAVWKLKDGFQQYVREEVVPDGAKFSLGHDVTWMSIGSAASSTYFPNGMNAKAFAQNMYLENALIALLKNTKTNPNYDVIAAVIASWPQSAPKPIDIGKLDIEYTGDKTYNSHFIATQPR